MEIKNNQNTGMNFSFNPSIENIRIDEIELDLSSKPNLFSSAAANRIVLDKEIEKKTNPIKRLNTYDNAFLKLDKLDSKPKNNNIINYFINRDFTRAFNGLKVSFKGFFEGFPVVNFFFLKEKQTQLKEAINTLNSINNDVDELMKLSVPNGEKTDKYKVLTESLMRANNINSTVFKNIK